MSENNQKKYVVLQIVILVAAIIVVATVLTVTLFNNAEMNKELQTKQEVINEFKDQYALAMADTYISEEDASLGFTIDESGWTWKSVNNPGYSYTYSFSSESGQWSWDK